ncbi:hypothetical protein HYX09_00780 [Candidatus Woesearchaeota archaeon]|nr:hypothetical protein [Candidatus Woesearchaeota archaeon]
MAASSPIEVFDPTEISGITRYSDLSDPGILSSASNYDFHGQRPDFLPLHHLVKILGKRVYLNESGDKYAYLLGSSSHQTDQMTDIAARNLRGLEYMLLGFSSRILPGQSLDLQIEGRRVQVPYHEGSYYTEGDPVVQGLRRILEKSGVHALPHYHLKRIKDGNQKVGTSLHVVAEPRVYRDENRATKSVIISYLTHVNAVG